MSIMGTLGAYEEQTRTGVWTRLEEQYSEDVSWVRDTSGVEINEDNLGDFPREYLGKKHLNASRVHPVERLPKEWVGQPNEHEGSHQFLALDFIQSLLSGKLPPNHAWIAARYNAPGIAAYESAKREGELMRIPDFGRTPANAQFLDPRYSLRP